MTTKLEQAARQIIVDWDSGIHLHETITALREALAEQAEQEPVGYFAYDEEHDIWEELTSPDAPGATPLYAAPQPMKQEPVGVVEGSGEWGIAGVLVAGVPIGTKLYASPVRTKDLTDEEIWDLWESNKNETAIEFYEAIIAAYKEKNK